MTNVNITSHSHPPVARLAMGIFIAVIYSVIFLFGTLGNGLVIYVTGCRMKRTVNSVWFLNLALADFLFTAFLLFSIISVAQDHKWQFGLIMCKLNSFVVIVSMFASIFFLTAISLDRCLCVCVAVWAHNKRTVCKTYLIAAVVWVAAVVCSAPYATFRALVTDENGTFLCAYAPGAPIWPLSIFRFVMGFAIPFLVITVCYVAIGVRVKRLQRTRKRRSHRVILSVIFAFFICWLPFHVVQFIEYIHRNNEYVRQIIPTVGPLTVCLAFLNSCLNPILYVFMCEEFQKKLKQSVCFVLESALAEDHLSLMSSRSLSSHISRVSRKSESSASPERKDTHIYLNFTETKVIFTEEGEIASSE